jgi:phage terminase large subunit-like protein
MPIVAGSVGFPEPASIDQMIKAEKCRRSLYEYTKEFWEVLEPGNPFIDGFHVGAICDHLQAVNEGLFKNLIICIPPGFAKSTIVSVMWPTWTWIDMPYIRAMFGSYDEKLTYRDSGKCRDVINSEKYQRMFRPDWKIKSDSNTKGFFENTLFGSRKTYYIRSSHKTGWRGNYVVVDDPLSAEHRYNKAIKLQCADTWDSTLWSRVNRQGRHAFVIIMQRLADDDLVGHVIEKYGQDYVQLILPNEFEPKRRCVTPIFRDPRTKEGELLCPRLMSEEKTVEAKSRLGPIDYEAQYQHNPIPLGGKRFRSEDFQYWHRTSNPLIIELHHRSKISGPGSNGNGKIDYLRVDLCQKVMSVDPACSEDEQNDFTSIGYFILTHKNELVLLKRISIQKDEYDIIEDTKTMFNSPEFGRNRPSVVYVEDNGLGKPIRQNMGLHLPVQAVTVSKVDLNTRSATASVRIRGGQIFFPAFDEVDWMHEFSEQLTRFPSAKHDDDVSMLSIAANSIFEQSPESPTSVATNGPVKPRFDAKRIQAGTARTSRGGLFGTDR